MLAYKLKQVTKTDDGIYLVSILFFKRLSAKHCRLNGEIFVTPIPKHVYDLRIRFSRRNFKLLQSRIFTFLIPLRVSHKEKQHRNNKAHIEFRGDGTPMLADLAPRAAVEPLIN